MFWATLASFFDGLSTILWKKAMAYNKLGWGVFVWFAFSAPFLALLFCLPFGFVRGPHEIALVAFALLALSGWLHFVSAQLNSRAYSMEKISALQPYGKINSLVALVGGFFLFHDGSPWGLVCGIMCILTVVTYALWQTKGTGDRRLSVGVFLCIISRCINGAVLLLYAKIVHYMTPLELHSYGGFMMFFCLGLFFFFSGEHIGLGYLRKNSKKFYFHRIFASLGGFAVRVITVFMIVQVGIVTTSLMGFLSLAVLLAFSFIFFRDIPKTSDVVVAVITLLFVLIGSNS